MTRDVSDNGSVELCPACYEYSGWENIHSDEDHDEDIENGIYHNECLVCQEIKLKKR